MSYKGLTILVLLAVATGAPVAHAVTLGSACVLTSVLNTSEVSYDEQLGLIRYCCRM